MDSHKLLHIAFLEEASLPQHREMQRASVESNNNNDFTPDARDLSHTPFTKQKLRLRWTEMRRGGWVISSFLSHLLSQEIVANSASERECMPPRFGPEREKW